MKAAITTQYGSEEVLESRDLPIPAIGDDQVLVRVHASPVTAGDMRLRSANFPALTKVPGHLMFGVLRPRRPVQGTNFAGRVVAVGKKVQRYAVGDDVFGSTIDGAYAEYLVVGEDAAMAKMPEGTSYAEAAAVPYGAITALRYLRDRARVKPGEEVLIIGGSGGVGRFAIQIAKHLGATVTVVCSPASFGLVRSLGADRVLDHSAELAKDAYDVIFDTSDTMTYRRMRPSLKRDGRYLTLLMTVTILVQMMLARFFGRKRPIFAIVFGAREDMEQMREWIERGIVKPVLGERFPLARIAEAHVAAKRARATVLVTMEAA